MKTNKVIINNINKKLLAGTIALTLLTTSFTGCARTDYFEYTTNKQGENTCKNVVEYSRIENGEYKVIVLEYKSTLAIYITEKVSAGRDHYYSVFGYNEVYSNDGSFETVLLEESNLVDYLVTYDRVQKNYTEEEMQEILEQIKTDYEKDKNKELVKE